MMKNPARPLRDRLASRAPQVTLPEADSTYRSLDAARIWEDFRPAIPLGILGAREVPGLRGNQVQVPGGRLKGRAVGAVEMLRPCMGHAVHDLQWFKREVILALFADNALMQQLVLKGGNLLDVVYGISTRPSRDIDLSICGEIEDLERFRRTIDKALGKWFEPKGYVVFDVNLREEPKQSHRGIPRFLGRLQGRFQDHRCGDVPEKLAGMTRTSCAWRAITVVGDDGKKFPIEISKHEYVDEKVTEIVDDLTVYAYSPRMLVAEKLRAICQQMPEYTTLSEETRKPAGKGFS